MMLKQCAGEGISDCMTHTHTHTHTHLHICVHTQTHAHFPFELCDSVQSSCPHVFIFIYSIMQCVYIYNVCTTCMCMSICCARVCVLVSGCVLWYCLVSGCTGMVRPNRATSIDWCVMGRWRKRYTTVKSPNKAWQVNEITSSSASAQIASTFSHTHTHTHSLAHR